MSKTYCGKGSKVVENLFAKDDAIIFLIKIGTCHFWHKCTLFCNLCIHDVLMQMWTCQEFLNTNDKALLLAPHKIKCYDTIFSRYVVLISVICTHMEMN